MLHQIGAGVLGPVFRAYQPDPGRLVAVKQFRLDLPPDSAHRFIAALDRLIAADLTHSGIAAPLAAGLESLTPFLAQDFVAADSFDVVMRDHGPAPVADALRVATQLAGALDFAAAVHVYHGSLHPRDVLVSAEDTRVTGLGIAQALESIGLSAPVRRPYTAPERIAGSAWDRRADVFSMAALIYEMLFGRRIAGLGDAAAEAITAVDGVDADALRALFARALAERPDDRYDSAVAFAEALRAVLGTATQATRAARGRRKRETNGGAARRIPPPELPLEPELPLALAEPDLPLVVEAVTQAAPQVLVDDVPVGDLPLASAPVAAASPVVSEVELNPAQPERYSSVEEGEPRLAPERGAIGVFGVLPESDARAANEAGPNMSAGDASAPMADTSVEPSTDPRLARAAVPAPAEPAPSFGSAALEQGRSAVWPIALALVVGLAVGFALGYGTGTRERTQAAASAASPSARPAELQVSNGAPAAQAPPDATPSAATAEVPAENGRSVPTGSPADGSGAGASAAAVPVTPATAPPADVALRAADPPAAPSSRESGAAQRPELPGASRSGPSSGGPDAAVRVTGRLSVRSTPAGARVTVDGREAGVTPTTVRELTVGTHVVRIAHQGYVTAERRVRIRTAQTAQSIEVDLAALRPARQGATPAAPPERTSGLPADARGAKAGSLMVDSRPAGARVFVDGKLVGTTPLLLDSIDAGEHTVRLELDGFRAWTTGTKVTGGERTRVSGSLEQR